jgi:hypothetical protein
MSCADLTPTRADAADADAQNTALPDEPTKEACDAAVAKARVLADTLPTSDLSRVFAESYLLQAVVEAGNGEFDDCIERAEEAVDEVKERRHVLPPGKTLKDLGLREPEARR